MDRIEKFLKQLGEKDRLIMLAVLADIRRLELDRYDVKALKGYKGVYRLRKGKIRFVFAETQSGGVLIDINYRSKIYRDL